MNNRVCNVLNKEARVGKGTMLLRRLGLLETPKGGLGFGNLKTSLSRKNPQLATELNHTLNTRQMNRRTTDALVDSLKLPGASGSRPFQLFNYSNSRLNSKLADKLIGNWGRNSSTLKPILWNSMIDNAAEYAKAISKRSVASWNRLSDILKYDKQHLFEAMRNAPDQVDVVRDVLSKFKELDALRRINRATNDGLKSLIAALKTK